MDDLRSLGHAALLGALTGVRSAAGPAALARELGNKGWWRRPRTGVRGWLADDGVETALTALAIGEMVVDKIPGIPRRTAPLPLAGRVAIGATLGALAPGRKAAPSERALGAAVGGLAAALSAAVSTGLRERFGDGTVPGGVMGLLEDAAVAAVARKIAGG